MGSVDTPGYACGVAVSGTHAYVADGYSGLQVIDITNPASPQIVGSVDTPGDACGVAVSGTHAYVADDAVRSPGDRHHESPEPPDRGQRGHAGRMPAAWPSRAPTPTSRTSDSGLQVIDITNPQSPQIVGSVDTPGYAHGVAVSGTHAYVADDDSGLQVIDITNPAEPPDRGQRGHAGLCLWRGRLGHPRLRRGLRTPVSR